MTRTALTEQSATTAHGDAAEILAEARTAIRPGFHAAVGSLPEPLRRVAGYQAGLWDAGGAPDPARAESGKAVRAALVLGCAAAVSGPVSEAAVSAAVGVELVHEFTLLHDDVMDGDVTRRGKPAAWTVFGPAQALLAGNALLALALRSVAAGACSSVLADAAIELCAGQAADLAEAGAHNADPSGLARSGARAHDGPDPRPSLSAVLRTAELKTAALFGAACELGARAAGADDPRSYRDFGRLLGRAFQLVDDVLGLWGDPAATGKPVARRGADLGHRSAPVVWALASGTEAAERLAEALAGPSRAAAAVSGKVAEPDAAAPSTEPTNEPIAADPVTGAPIADLIAATGARRWALAEARRLTDAAILALDRAGPRPQGAADLQVLASALVDRVT